MIIGSKFGRLTVIELSVKKSGNTRLWKCVCDCGTVRHVRKHALTSGNTKSCGCYKNDIIRNVAKQNITHGMSNTRIYRVWEGMKRRCDVENSERYKSYGGRGITYCDEWDSFEGFYEWAKDSGYEEGLTIDRIDVNGNYEPSNCRWSTWLQQSYNKTNSRKFSYEGEELTVAELARISGKSYHLVYQRLVKLGWNVRDAITKK